MSTCISRYLGRQKQNDCPSLPWAVLTFSEHRNNLFQDRVYIININSWKKNLVITREGKGKKSNLITNIHPCFQIT